MNTDQIKRIHEYYDIPLDRFEKSGAFNAIIGVDRPFFVDPSLLEQNTIPEFQGAKGDLDSFFSSILTLINGGADSAIRRANRLMILREIRGVGIGYGSKTDDGSAIGPKLARRLVSSAQELLQMGFNDPAIFQLMGIFEEDFGADRISDAVINILQDRIYSYTLRVSTELGIECTRETKSKSGNVFILPEHPSGKKPLVLVPQSLLRDIPIALSPEDIPYVASYNDELRERFNRILAPIFAKKRPSKAEIKRYLLQNPQRMRTLLNSYKDAHPQSYDFENDPEGIQRWIGESEEAVAEIVLEIPKKLNSDQELDVVVSQIIGAFKKFIETKGGWRGLYGHHNKPLHEEHACLLFYATALKYCADSNIDISPQSNAGQGPVDFKLSRGTSKIIVEVKLTSGNVRQGYTKQTRIYQAAEDAQKAYFVVMRVTDSSKALEDVIKQAEQEEMDKIDHPELIIIDGRPRESASKVK